MADMTEDDVLQELIPEVNRRARFDSIENMILTPTDDEIIASIYDALDEINASPPQTHFGLVQTYTQTDTRWKRMLLMGATKNTVGMLIFDWVGNGITAKFDDDEFPTRLGDYTALNDKLDTEFTRILEGLKKTSQKFVRVSHYRTTNNRMFNFTARLDRYYKSVQLS